jgi:hypothetical protein
VIFSTGVAWKVGAPLSTGPGCSTSWPSLMTSRNTIGCVLICAIQVPQLDPEQAPIQSMQLGSCSAPITTVPPLGTGPVLVMLEPPDDGEALPLPELPQAESVRARAVATTSARGKNRAMSLTRQFLSEMKAVT